MKENIDNKVKDSISIIDEIFETKRRQNIIGVLFTGIGGTVMLIGIAILTTK